MPVIKDQKNDQIDDQCYAENHTGMDMDEIDDKVSCYQNQKKHKRQLRDPIKFAFYFDCIQYGLRPICRLRIQ